MIDLSAVSHDDLIAEVQCRLDAGLFGWHGLLSTDQQNHRDNWHHLIEAVYDARNRYPDEFGTRLVHARALEIVDRGGPQTRMYAINTTLPGVADPASHQAALLAAE